MRNLLFLVLWIVLGLSLSACQGFLEDYDYSPVGPVSSTPSY